MSGPNLIKLELTEDELTVLGGALVWCLAHTSGRSTEVTERVLEKLRVAAVAAGMFKEAS